jgi:hypothetical protein
MKFRTYVKLPERMRGLEVPPEGRAGWATQSISGSGTEDTTQHVVRIEWDLEDGHLSGFARALKFRRFEAVGPFVHDIQSMRHYVITPSSAKVG